MAKDSKTYLIEVEVFACAETTAATMKRAFRVLESGKTKKVCWFKVKSKDSHPTITQRIVATGLTPVRVMNLDKVPVSVR